ncbi:hypothetical protein QL285_090169 [Trifolium repens]|nr:hypothetical protein QL285_090169 [Trifolium repens]
MIRSSNGVRLVSSHLIREACISIYEGLFHRKLDSGIWTLSRVIGGGHGTVNPNSRLLSNTSIRGSVSLSRPDYEISNYFGRKAQTPVKGVTEKKIRNGFKNWCKRYGFIFSSEGEKNYMFKWFCDNHPYGRDFYFGGNGGLPTVSHNDLIDHIRKFGYDDSEEAMEDLLEKSSRYLACRPLDQEEVFYSNELPWDELDEYCLKKRCSPGCYIGSDRQPDIERST